MQTAPWRGVAALRTGWRGGRTSAPPPPGSLAAPVIISCRVTFLAFLVHQRFSNEEELVVASGGSEVANGSLCGPCIARALSAPYCAVGGPSWRSWPDASRSPPRSRELPRGPCSWPPSSGSSWTQGCCGAFRVGHMDVGNLRLRDQDVRVVRPVQLDGAGGTARCLRERARR